MFSGGFAEHPSIKQVANFLMYLRKYYEKHDQYPNVRPGTKQ